MTSGNIRKENVMQIKKKASAPSYQLDGAHFNRIGNDAVNIIPSERKRPTAHEQLEADRFRVGFRVGFMVGFLAAALIFLAVLWLWVIPAMDGAVATAQAAYQTSAGVLHA